MTGNNNWFLPFLFLSVMGWGILWAQPSGADTQNAPPGGRAMIVPTSAWLVGAAVVLPEDLDRTGQVVPCVAAVHYDQGHFLKLSVVGDTLTTLAFETRTDQAQNHDGQPPVMRLQIPPHDPFFRQTTFAPSSLNSIVIADMRDRPDFSARVADSDILVLTIGADVFPLLLGDIRNGLARARACSRGATQSGESALSGSALPAPPEGEDSALTMPEPPEEKDLADVGPLLIDGTLRILARTPTAIMPVSPSGGADSGAPVSLVPPAVPVWQAVKGDDLRDILSRWAERAGVDLVWTATGRTEIGADFRYDGRFEDAVQTLLQMHGRKRGLSGRFQARAGDTHAAQESSRAGIRQWRAVGGTSLREVLELWTWESGHVLLWESPADFKIPVTLESESSFAEAVRVLLEQFPVSPRPLGTLHKDPQTGQTILLITRG